MNHPTLRSSQPEAAAAAPLAELAFDDEEHTVPSTPYVPRGNDSTAHDRGGRLVRWVVGLFAALGRWSKGA
jgi:hypothetical protein